MELGGYGVWPRGRRSGATKGYSKGEQQRGAAAETRRLRWEDWKGGGGGNGEAWWGCESGVVLLRLLRTALGTRIVAFTRSDCPVSASSPFSHTFCVHQLNLSCIGLLLPHPLFPHICTHRSSSHWSLPRLAGRVYRKAASGAKLLFYDVKGEGCKVQVIADARNSELDLAGFQGLHNDVKTLQDTRACAQRGDIVGVEGYPGKSKKGELSIFPTKFTVLSPCLHMPPSSHFGLKDQETRYRQRYLDLICNPDVRNIFITRTRVIQFIRRFLDTRGACALSAYASARRAYAEPRLAQPRAYASARRAYAVPRLAQPSACRRP
eukprot:53054-Chlamydomonas_euryale.AAC.1